MSTPSLLRASVQKQLARSKDIRNLASENFWEARRVAIAGGRLDKHVMVHQCLRTFKLKKAALFPRDGLRTKTLDIMRTCLLKALAKASREERRNTIVDALMQSPDPILFSALVSQREYPVAAMLLGRLAAMEGAKPDDISHMLTQLCTSLYRSRSYSPSTVYTLANFLNKGQLPRKHLHALFDVFFMYIHSKNNLNDLQDMLIQTVFDFIIKLPSNNRPNIPSWRTLVTLLSLLKSHRPNAYFERAVATYMATVHIQTGREKYLHNLQGVPRIRRYAKLKRLDENPTLFDTQKPDQELLEWLLQYLPVLPTEPVFDWSTAKPAIKDKKRRLPQTTTSAADTGKVLLHLPPPEFDLSSLVREWHGERSDGS